MAHFSKYIRPNAEVIGVDHSDKDLQITAAQNTDGSIAVVVFNEGNENKQFNLSLNGETKRIAINSQAIQTIIIPTK